jgi:hypothetical protein
MYEAKTKHRIDEKAEIQFLTKMFPAVLKSASKPYDMSSEMKYIEKLYPRRYTPSTDTTDKTTLSDLDSSLQYSPSCSMKTPVQTKALSPPSTEPRYIPSCKKSTQEAILKRRKARVSCFKQANS